MGPEEDQPEGRDAHVNLVASWVTIIVAIVSAAATAFSAYSLRKTPAFAQLVNAVFTLAALSIGFLAALLYVARSYARKQRQVVRLSNDRTRSQLLEEAGVIARAKAAQQRKLISIANANFLSAVEANGQAGDSAKLEEMFRHYLDMTLAGVASLFHALTGFECASCVKVLTSEAGDALQHAPGVQPLYVRMLRRDPQSHLTRSAIDSAPDVERFLYRRNTGFYAVLDDKFAPAHYICNDLNALGAEYENLNPEWRRLYNATAIVPIKQVGAGADRTAIGLLCIDNFGGGFVEAETVAILEGIAAELYHSLTKYHSTLNRLREYRHG